MRKTSVGRFVSLRQTSVRGLDPARVLVVVASLIVCGFAFGKNTRADDTSAKDSKQAEVVVETRAPLHELSPGAQRERLLADTRALNRATLWLARCIYSESHRREEQYLVGWVVRNRVETRYRGESTYSGVVTDPFQFSAFNPDAIDREFLMAVDTTYVDRGWMQALEVARNVILADPDDRPFPITTRHFYSERSLGDLDIPLWALEYEPVSVAPFAVDERRFRFFDGVS